MTSGQPCIMVIGAHAADAELMGGGAILAHNRLGWRSVIVHLTLGEKGHKSLGPIDYAQIKGSEAVAAAEAFGSDLESMAMVDGELPVHVDVQWKIADLIRKHRPKVVVTHWKGSSHLDHINTYLNVVEAVGLAGLESEEREYPAYAPRAVYFGESFEDIEGFVPEFYLDISNDWTNYQKAVGSYGLVRGDSTSFRHVQWYDGISKSRGAERGVDRAVALMPHVSLDTRRKTVKNL